MNGFLNRLSWQGVVALGILAAAATVMSIFADGETLTTMKWIAWGAVGGSFVPSAIKGTTARREDPDPNGNSLDRSGPTAMLLAVTIAGSFLTGCGAGNYDTHAFTALALRDSANAAEMAYREERKDHMRQAAFAVQARGGSAAEIGQAIDAAAAEFDTEFQDLREAHAAFVEAVSRYTQASFDRLRGVATDADTIVAAGRAAIDAYNRVARILRRHGFQQMPELPEGAAEFLRVLIPAEGT